MFAHNALHVRRRHQPVPIARRIDDDVAREFMSTQVAGRHHAVAVAQPLAVQHLPKTVHKRRSGAPAPFVPFGVHTNQHIPHFHRAVRQPRRWTPAQEMVFDERGDVLLTQAQIAHAVGEDEHVVAVAFARLIRGGHADFLPQVRFKRLGGIGKGLQKPPALLHFGCPVAHPRADDEMAVVPLDRAKVFWYRLRRQR